MLVSEAGKKGGLRCGLTAGERNGSARLTWAQVRAIRQALAEGVSGYVLARRYEVSEMTISRIRRGECWRE